VAPEGYKGKHPSSALWIAAQGEPARQLTSGVAEDNDPRWSPDGTRLLFRSDRIKPGKEESQLYVLPLAGGEATPLGDFRGKLSLPSWSPKGDLVAVLRRDPESEEKKRRKKERDDAIVVEEAPHFTRLWVIDPDTNRARCLTSGEREVRTYEWLLDGTGLVAVTTDAIEYDAVFGPAELVRIPLGGGLARKIACFRTTPWSPIVVETIQGDVVAVRADGHRDQPSDSIWTVPLKGGEPRNLLPDLVGIVEEIAPIPGRRGQVAARIVAGTRGRIYSVDALDGTTEPLSPTTPGPGGSYVQGISFSHGGERLAAIWSNGATPEEVYAGEPGGAVSALTTFGKAFCGRLQPTEHVTWTAEDGQEIEGILTYPTNYDPGKRYPLVVEIHGGPSWQWEDRVMLNWHDWAQWLASRGYAVLMPNPRGSTGYGHEFQQLLQDDVGGGESRDLIAGALAMVERGIADPERLGIAGWSWGGYLTALTITQSRIFRAAVMGAGLSNMVSDHGQGDIPSANLLYYPGLPYQQMDVYWKSSPIRYVADVRTPTLILHGEEDARVHPAQGMEYFRALKSLGVPVRFVRYPREKHPIRERAHQIDLLQRIADWFDQYLQGRAGREVSGFNDSESAESGREASRIQQA
jgi:dipeptidyl aminopeptidase/acylaminoacyl peptidase